MSAAIPKENIQTPQQPPSVQTTAPVQKNSKLLKVAIIGLVIVLAIILSEVGFLIFSGYGRTYFQLKSEPQEIVVVPTIVPTPIPTPSVEITLPENRIQSNKISDFLYILENLEPKEAFIDAITINSTYKGVVIGTSQEEIDNVGLRHIIDVKNDQEQTIRFQFSSQEIDSAEIYLSSNNNESISFNDIKSNDNLEVKIVSDLLDSSSDSKLILAIERGN